MSYSEIYIKRIRELCQKRNISINKLASLSGIGQSTLDNIMHKKSQNPRVKTLHKIAHAFGMTLAEFLDIQELNLYEFDEEKD